MSKFEPGDSPNYWIIRATGCPDTMDDTARFAADELPAILRKQAG